MVRIFPITCESLAEDGVERFLDATRTGSAIGRGYRRAASIRGPDMPSTQVEFDHRNESLNWIIDLGHGQKRFRVCHEAVDHIVSLFSSTLAFPASAAYFVILSSIDLGSRMNVGSTTLLRSAPGRSCEIMCERTVDPA